MPNAEFDPWVGKIPWRRARQPTPVSLPGESPGQRSLAGCSPWGHKESDKTGHVYTVLDFPQMWSSSQMLKHHVALKQRRIWYKVSWKSVCLYCKHFKQTGAEFLGDIRFQKATKPQVWASLKDMSQLSPYETGQSHWRWWIALHYTVAPPLARGQLHRSASILWHPPLPTKSWFVLHLLLSSGW